MRLNEIVGVGQIRCRQNSRIGIPAASAHALPHWPIPNNPNPRLIFEFLGKDE
jgi:hypothetical protein